MSKNAFSSILAAIGIAPKTLDGAKATIDSAAPVMKQIGEMFSEAGLDLDGMIAQGPGALKAHLGKFEKSAADLTAANDRATAAEAENANLKASEATAKGDSNSFRAQIAEMHAAVGFKPAANATTADFKTAFTAHVGREAAVVAAKAGHPVVDHVPAPVAGDKKPQVEGKTGLAKVAAVFAAKSPARK